MQIGLQVEFQNKINLFEVNRNLYIMYINP